MKQENPKSKSVKLKILFSGRYNTTEILNGPEKVAKRIFGEYSAKNNTAFAEYFFDGDKYSILKKVFGSENVTEVNKSEVKRFGAVSLFFFLFRYKPSVIHIITFERFSLICFLYKFFRKVKIVYNVHGIITYENNVLKKTGRLYSMKDSICEKIFLKYSDRLIFLSDDSVKLADSMFSIDRNKISMIPNGTDEVFRKSGTGKILNVSEPLRIVFAGDEFRKEKGFDFLVDALGDIDFETEIYLIGSFKKFTPGKTGNALFFISDKMETEKFACFLLDKDIFVSSSSYEQFSITAGESMAAGLVPVVTAETGMSSYIKNRDNGFIFSYGDKDGFIEIIRLLNSDRSLLHNISLRSAEIYNELSWSNIISEYIKVYE